MHLRRPLQSAILLSLCLLPISCNDGSDGSTSESASSETAETDGLAIVAYLPDYRVGEFEPWRANGIDQLIYFSVEVEPDGSLDSRRLRETTLEKLETIKTAVDCDILICVGGWGRSDGFSEMSASAESRARFAEELIELCHEHNFAGVDLDWEHPSTPEDRHQLTVLLQELQPQLAAEELLLTVACAPWQPLNNQAADAVDCIHLMSYDDEGRHSTLEQAVANLDKWISAGVPAEKILLGVPFYGRRFAGGNRSSATYGEIAASYELEPETDEAGGYYFNGPATMQAKVKLAIERGLAGIMIWEIAQDSSDDEASLLRVIHDTVDRP